MCTAPVPPTPRGTARTSFKWLPAVAQEVRGHGYTVRNRAPPSRLTPRPRRAAVGNGLPLTAGVRPPFKRAGLAPPGLDAAGPLSITVNITEQEVEGRGGGETRARCTIALVWQLLGSDI